MPGPIRDPHFRVLLDRGLIDDLTHLAAYRGSTLDVQPTDDGWRVALISDDIVFALERTPEKIELCRVGTDLRRGYSCDAEGVVGAVIDLMKLAVKK